jgi:hypothetical protein
MDYMKNIKKNLTYPTYVGLYMFNGKKIIYIKIRVKGLCI